MTSPSSASDGSRGGAYGPALRSVLAFSGGGRTRPRRDRILREQRGLSIVELLVSMIVLAGLMAAVAPVVISQVRQEPEIRKSSDRIREARTVMERLGREVRMAYAVDSASATQFVFRTYTRHATCGGTAILNESATPTQCKVTYSCASGTCTRTEESVAGGGSPAAVQLVSGLQSDNVFAFEPDAISPVFVEITLVMPGRTSSEDAITLHDGFEMRNVTPIS